MFAGAGELIQILDRLVQINRLANLLEAKRGLDLQPHGNEETGTAEAAEGGHEKIRVLRSGTSDFTSVRQEQTEGQHMRGDYTIVDACPVCRGGYYPREGLIRDGTEVGHSEAHGTQSGVKFVKCDTGFGDDKTFFSIDLFE